MGSPLVEDTRRILALIFADDSFFRVGVDRTTSIEVYGESGECSLVPWFMVKSGDEVLRRVNAAQVQVVEYAPATPTEPTTTKPDDTTPETCPTCGSSDPKVRRYYDPHPPMRACRLCDNDTFHTTPETSREEGA